MTAIATLRIPTSLVASLVAKGYWTDAATSIRIRWMPLPGRINEAGGGGGGPYYARELALHQEAGIPAWAILCIATSGAADILGIGNRTGRIEPGFEADLVFHTADPSVDVVNAAKVYGVLNNGRLLLAESLIGP